MCPVSTIQLISADTRGNSQAAIVKGAALRGLEGLKPTTTISRRHYGWSWDEPFREGIDDEKNGYIDVYNGEKMCRGKMHWPIKKVSSPCPTAQRINL
jgi:hypothetical protein